MNSQKNKQPKNKTEFDKATSLVILYFIEKLNGVLGKTHLQKMLFLTDLLATKNFKNKITAIDYKKYTFGPFSEQLDAYTSMLKERNLIQIREFPFISEPEKTYTRFYLAKKINSKSALLKVLKPEQVLLIDEIVNSYGNLSLQEVLDIVYDFQIVKNSKQNNPLDMAEEFRNEADKDEVELL